MSYNLISTAQLGIGTWLAYSGINNLGTLNRQPRGEESHPQKKYIETAKIIFGLWMMLGGISKIYVEDNLDVFDPTKCDPHRLDLILEKGNKINRGAWGEIYESPETIKHFELFKSTQGITCENFLPWRDEFGPLDYVDGVKYVDLSKPIMWGIAPGERPFIAVRHMCENLKQGVQVFFQRYHDIGRKPLYAAGHAPSCIPYSLKTPFAQRVEWMKDLFEKGKAQCGNETISLA